MCYFAFEVYFLEENNYYCKFILYEIDKLDGHINAYINDFKNDLYILFKE